jgi:dihydrofolate reductase
MISIIVAMSRNLVIGKDNGLTWHLPADLRHFKETTMGKPLIMGRKTYESMKEALPGRTNIVITRQDSYKAPGCLVAATPEKAVEMAKDEKEIFIAGGGEIYRHFMPVTDRMYVTVVDHDFEGDTHFPRFSLEEWKLISDRHHGSDDRNPYSMFFRVYERAKPADGQGISNNTRSSGNP